MWLASFEYPDMIEEYNELKFNLRQITSILIGLEHQLDNDRIINIGLEFYNYIYLVYAKWEWMILLL